MAKPTITIDIDEDGTPTVEVHGVKGSGCLAVSKALEEALGAVTTRTKTKEYYETDRTAVHQRSQA